MEENEINLKDFNVKEFIVKEILRCKQDPVYFFKEYVWIQHPIRGRIKFNLYPFQEKVLKDLNDNQFSIILKSRQLGISTLCAGLSLWIILFQDDKNILTIATKEKVAKNLVAKVGFGFRNLPKWMLHALNIKCREFNKLSISLSNGSCIKAASAAGDDSRSEALSLLLIDEAAFVRNAEQVWASAQSTLSTGGKGILLSTPNGQKGFFWKMWADAIDGVNGFNPIKLDWKVHPERDQTWRDEQTLRLGERMASQECDGSFISSGNTVVKGEILEWYTTVLVKEPIQRYYSDLLWLWDYPDSTRKYLISCDVARGDGSDYSAFHILDIETLDQVGEFKGKIGTTELAKLLRDTGYEWNNAVISIENASMGWGVVQDMIQLDYKNLYYTPKREMPNDYEYIDYDNFTPGFTNSSKTRPLIINKLEEYLNNKLVVIRSIRTIHELQAFIWYSHRAEASQGSNDDLVLSLAEGIYVRDLALRGFSKGFTNFYLNQANGFDPLNSSPGYNSLKRIPVIPGKGVSVDENDPYFGKNMYEQPKQKSLIKNRPRYVGLP